MTVSNLIAIMVAIFLVRLVGGCSRPATIIGTWRSDGTDERVTLVFGGDGRFRQHYVKRGVTRSVDFEKTGTYSLGPSNLLVMRFDRLSIPATISYSLTSDQLSLGWPGDTRVKSYRRERD